MTEEPIVHAPTLPAIQMARTPRRLRRAARLLMLIAVALVPVLLFMPWTQTVYGSGQAIAFNPVQRPQSIISPIEGRVLKWHVVEGDRVVAGEVLVDLVDNDPQKLERLREQELLAEQRLTAVKGQLINQQNRLLNIQEQRVYSLAEASARVAQAEAKVLEQLQEMKRAKADQIREKSRFERLNALLNTPVGRAVSKDEVEEAQRKSELATEMIPLVEATIQSARKAVEAAEASLKAIDEQTKGNIESEKRLLKATEADRDKVRQEVNMMQTDVRRQENQRILAPATGTIFRILANAEAGGQLVRPGERLALLVPDIEAARPISDSTRQLVPALFGSLAEGALSVLTSKDYPGIVAELTIDGNDLPLVRPGDRVLLQFEGWAAVQFAAYPDAAAGTFEGTVYLVDPTTNGDGQFRILVEPASGEEWPDATYLRQGVRTQGWILIKEVTVGYEMWRLLNGFPPAREIETNPDGSRLGPVSK